MSATDLRANHLHWTEPRPRAHVWVRDGLPTLTIITDAADDFCIDWPERNGALLVFDAAYDVTVSVVQP